MSDPSGEDYMPPMCEDDCNVENCTDYCERVQEYHKLLESQNTIMHGEMYKSWLITLSPKRVRSLTLEQFADWELVQSEWEKVWGAYKYS